MGLTIFNPSSRVTFKAEFFTGSSIASDISYFAVQIWNHLVIYGFFGMAPNGDKIL